MKTNTHNNAYVPKSSRLATLLAFSAGILAGSPVWAGYTVPDSPLQTGSRVPANLMLVLDDSGSMGSDYMPDTVPNITTTDDFRNQVYTRNTIYYNPAVTYRPWRTAVGGRVADTPYNCVYNSNTLLTGCVNLGAADRVFHVPKPGITNIADGSQYDRFVFRSTGGVQKGVWVAGAWAYTPVTDFSWPVVGPPATTIVRTIAEEKQNFATWFSFHRTRNKTAKAGVSESFADLGEDIRVGFNTIWNNNTYNIPVGSDNGLFRDLGASTNRSTWYNRLQTAPANGFTPLRTSLTRTGEYFLDTTAAGPYGPQTGASQITCRQNFTIFTTDGFWNGTNGNDAEAAPYVARGNSDNTSNANYTPALPFKDAWSNTLADIAMHYWKTDLRPDMTDNVPTTSANRANWQHMVTFGISIGLRGALDPIADLISLTNGTVNSNGTTGWPDPFADKQLARIDDLFHASVNGHGEFVAASDPEELAKALKSALASILGRVGSSSNVAANSVSVGAGSTRIFQASYQTGQWTGELSSLPVTGGVVSSTAEWKATETIPVWGTRRIFTYESAAGTTFPTAIQEASLTTPIANFIKGDRSNEISQSMTGTLRDRVNVLGDIVNSSPAYSSESNTVFIGANDGMMHAFNAATGAELFAYIPGIVNLTNLKTLADKAYDHRYFVDGPLAVSAKKLTPNKNILVGSLGRGGKGLYALDVTTPATFDGSKALWEVSGSDDDMGFITSRPIITKANNGSTVVIVSNGLNSTNDDPALFIYDLFTGTRLAKLLPIEKGGNDVFDNNGLSAATGVDQDVDGDVDYMYAGDMKGNVWKFDLSDNNPNNWEVANNDYPLYSAKDSTGTITQSISGGIAIGFDAEFNPWLYFGTGRYLTAGDPSTTSVQTWYGIVDESTNTTIAGRGALKARKIVAAGELDNGSGTGVKVRAFEPQEFPSGVSDMYGKKGWYIDLVNPPFTAAQKVGERIVGTPVVRGTTVLVSSIIPSEDPCTVEGSGYVNAVDALTGSSGVYGSESYFDVNGGGFDNDKLVSTIDGREISIGSIDLGIKMPTDALVLAGDTNELVVVGGSIGGTGSAPFRGTRAVGRISWHEMINN